eukprot:scaffold1616_cov310-Pinguiococcus_pyrenoidosus.AAC.11
MAHLEIMPRSSAFPWLTTTVISLFSSTCSPALRPKRRSSVRSGRTEKPPGRRAADFAALHVPRGQTCDLAVVLGLQLNDVRLGNGGGKRRRLKDDAAEGAAHGLECHWSAQTPSALLGFRAANVGTGKTKHSASAASKRHVWLGRPRAEEREECAKRERLGRGMTLGTAHWLCG